MTPIEPSAEMRQLANVLRQMYVALLDQGFTVPEALQIIGYTLAANAGKGGAE